MLTCVAYAIGCIAGWWAKGLCIAIKVKEMSSANPSDIQCPVCGYYCLGRGGIGCINKPSMQDICTACWNKGYMSEECESCFVHKEAKDD